MHSARSKTFWLLLSLGAGFALLAWSAQRPTWVTSQTGVSPPLRSVDGPVPRVFTDWMDEWLGVNAGSMAVAGSISTSVWFCVPGHCTPHQLNQVLAAYRRRIRPALGTYPRVVADLRSTATLVAWRNQASQLCLAAMQGHAIATPMFGPCLAVDGHCAALCLVSAPRGAHARISYLLAGTVRRDATMLRITTARARTVYPLSGPLLWGSDKRVFMLDLGRDDYRTLELLRGRTVIDSVTMSYGQASIEDCVRRHPVVKDYLACANEIQSIGRAQ